MAPLEPWEKVLVNAEEYLQTVHGKISCIECHGGEASNDKETAHANIIARPSSNPETCSKCHANITATYPNSLHATQQGYWTTLETRSTPENHPALEEMFGNHCASCHTSCGDCHVSQPLSVGGGFIDGHIFNSSPSMTRNCTACHGSRVGNEYLGKHEDLKADIHFRQGRMKCTDCHGSAELHGELAAGEEIQPVHRYEGEQVPRCENCHANVGSADDQIDMHQMHGEKLSCQVCHSISYTSCDGCHVAVSDETGNPFFKTENTYLNFLIGRNSRQDDTRPYEFVPVRHIPIAETSYQFYGEDLLPNFIQNMCHKIHFS